MVNFDSEPLTEDQLRRMNEKGKLERELKKENILKSIALGGIVVGAGSLYYGMINDNDLYLDVGYGILLADFFMSISYGLSRILKENKITF